MTLWPEEDPQDNINLSRADWLRIVVVGIAFAAPFLLWQAGVLS